MVTTCRVATVARLPAPTLAARTSEIGGRRTNVKQRGRSGSGAAVIQRRRVPTAAGSGQAAGGGCGGACACTKIKGAEKGSLRGGVQRPLKGRCSEGEERGGSNGQRHMEFKGGGVRPGEACGAAEGGSGPGSLWEWRRRAAVGQNRGLRPAGVRLEMGCVGGEGGGSRHESGGPAAGSWLEPRSGSLSGTPASQPGCGRAVRAGVPGSPTCGIPGHNNGRRRFFLHSKFK
jgi:hypothetical protein